MSDTRQGNNLAAKPERPKLFIVTYIANSNKEETPITTQPVGYEEAMRLKAEAEASKKYDLSKGFFAALKLTEEQYDRYEAKKGQAASPAAKAEKVEKPAPAAKAD